ncbi:MAG: hypothetical protein AB7F99_00540 [Vicinamibacterales bacterium]
MEKPRGFLRGGQCEANVKPSIRLVKPFDAQQAPEHVLQRPRNDGTGCSLL